MPKTEMLINYVRGEECRIAIVEDGQLEELYQERQSSESHVGNIYKGRVSNVEPAIQAAFIDFGLERNGFLHITDLHPRYFPGKDREETERVGKKTPHRHRPPIQQCLKRGQEILVQVIKEGIGTKGPTLSSYLSIAGRYLVMMPHMERLGVSRKIEDEEVRRSMRKVLDELEIPDGFGFILRTAGIGKSKTELKRDLSYLQRLWKAIDRRMKQPGVGELYTESDLVIRTLRDVFTTDIKRIIVDDPTAAKRASDFLSIASPRARSKVLYYSDPVPLYDRFSIEQQIETIQAREVPLKSGGSLVIDSTEALVAIDVNSGKMRKHKNSDVTAYKTNQEACDEVCRQLRLRDLGGVVVIDLIDMRETKKRRSIETQFRDNLKKDRARTKVLNISQLGLLEMTRQRMRPSLKKSVYNDCTHCHGTGHVKSVESVVLEVMRRLTVVMSRSDVNRVEVTVSPDVAFHLLNRKRGDIVHLEQNLSTQLLVRVNSGGTIDFINIEAFNDRGAVTPDGTELKGEPTLTPVNDLSEEELAELEADTDDQDDDDDAEDAKSDGGSSGKTANADKRSDDKGGKDSGQGGGQDKGDDGDEKPKRKRRRRRRRRKSSGGDGQSDGSGDDASKKDDTQKSDSPSDKDKKDDDKSDDSKDDDQSGDSKSGDDKSGDDKSGDSDESGDGKKKKRRRRRRRRKKSSDEGDAGAKDGEGEKDDAKSSDAKQSGAKQSSEDKSDDKSEKGGKDADSKSDNSGKSAESGKSGKDNAEQSDNDSGDEKPASKKKSKRKRSRRTKKKSDDADASKDDDKSASDDKKGNKDGKAGDDGKSDGGDSKADGSKSTGKKKTSRKKTAKRTPKKRSTTRKVYPPPDSRRSPE